MAKSAFRKGHYVNVLNTTMSGCIVFEGRAQILSKSDDRYLVDFGDGSGPVERFIDPHAQVKNVGKYVEELNDQMRPHPKPRHVE